MDFEEPEGRAEMSAAKHELSKSYHRKSRQHRVDFQRSVYRCRVVSRIDLASIERRNGVAVSLNMARI